MALGQVLTSPQSGWTRYYIKDYFNNSNIVFTKKTDWTLYNNEYITNWTDAASGSLSNADVTFAFTGTQFRLGGYGYASHETNCKLVFDGVTTTWSAAAYGNTGYNTVTIEKLGLTNTRHTVTIGRNAYAVSNTQVCITWIDINTGGTFADSMTPPVKYLVQDDTNIKKYQSGSWSTLGTGIPTESMFTDSTMTINDAITNIAGLTSATPAILRWDPVKTSIDISEGRYVSPKLIVQNYDIDIRSVANIDSFTLTVSQVDGGLVKVIASFDSGVTWKSWNGSIWETVDTNNLSTVKSLAMTVSVFNALTGNNWSDALETGYVRFAYYIEIVNYTDTASINTLACQLDMRGSWWSALQSEADYAYVDNNLVELTITKNGDYKINY